MAADGFEVRLEGVDELKRALAGLPDKLRKRVLGNALRKAARVIQQAAKAAAPVLRVPTPTRKPGTVQRAIAVRTSKFARREGNVGVYVNVRPIGGSKARVARFGKAGAKNPNDPFYWRFVELGTRKMAARPFMRTAAERKGGEAIATFMREVVPQIEKLNRSKA